MTIKRSTSKLIEYFYNIFTEDELIYAIELLDKEVIIETYKICGIKLDGVTKYEIDPKTKYHFATSTIPRLKNKLNKLYPEKMKQLKEKQEQVFNEQQKQKEEIVEIKKPTLVAKLSSQEEKVSQTIVEESSSTLEPSKELTTEDYLFIKKILSSPEYAELLKKEMPIEEIVVASLLHGFAYGKSLTIEQIAEFFNIETSIIRKIAINSINIINNEINNNLDKNILSLRSDNNEIK